MATSFDTIAVEVFNALKGFGKNITMFDEEGNDTFKPADGRRFFVKKDQTLGRHMVSLIDRGDESKIKLYLPNDTDLSDPNIDRIIQGLKHTAGHYNLLFDTRKMGQEITPKSFALTHTHESHERSNEMTDTLEETANPLKGSSRKSTQQWNEAKLVIKHSKPVKEDVRGSRSRNISKIFIETKLGERFLFPNTHLTAARAMARHVGAGGAFHDNSGQHIIGLSEDFKDLASVSSYIQERKNNLNESALSIRETARTRMKAIREEFHQFMTKSGYIKKIVEINSVETAPLNEDYTEILESMYTTLLLGENDTKMKNAVAKIAPLMKVTEEIIEEEIIEEEIIEEDGFTATDIENLYSKNDISSLPDDDDDEDYDFDKLDYDIKPERTEKLDKDMIAAANLLNTGDYTWLPKTGGSIPTGSTPLAKLQWRIRAMAERLSPMIPGQMILSNILTRISEKINQPGPNGKVNVTPNEHAIVMHFREIAPSINESMIMEGYKDWNLVEDKQQEIMSESEETASESVTRLEKKLTELQKHPGINSDQIRSVKKDIAHYKSQITEKKMEKTYQEVDSLNEWFDEFDPLKFLKEEEKEELDEGCDCECDCDGECGDDCKCKAKIEENEKVKETEVQKMVNKGLIETDVFKIATKIANGTKAMSEAEDELDEDDMKKIVECLKENFKEEVVESVLESANSEVFDKDGVQTAFQEDDQPAKATGDNKNGLTPIFPVESAELGNLLKNSGMSNLVEEGGLEKFFDVTESTDLVENKNHKPDCGCPFCNKVESKKDDEMNETEEVIEDEVTEEKETIEETGLKNLLKNAGMINMVEEGGLERFFNSELVEEEELDETLDEDETSEVDESEELDETEELDEYAPAVPTKKQEETTARIKDRMEKKKEEEKEEKSDVEESSDFDGLNNLLKNAGLKKKS